VRISQFFGRPGEPPTAPDPTKGLRFLLHLPNFVKLYWRLFYDSRVSLLPKVLLVAAIIYAISPLDFLPDWNLPIIGELDDIVVLLLALRAFIPLCPRAVVEEHVRLIDEGK
jgi:uncharacterized membrane protein YkvA (DUF1232 family)